MKLFQNGIAALVVGIGATAGFALGVYGVEIYTTLLGLGGFAGLAGLRSAINSSGSKTYIIAVGGALVSIGVGLGYVDPEVAAMVFALGGIGSLPTLKHGADKAGATKK